MFTDHYNVSDPADYLLQYKGGNANGKLRVFYNNYKKSMYGGCMCSFDQAYAAMYG